MQPLKNVLGKLIKDAGLESGVAITAVGEGIALHTYPDTIKGKVLNVLVDTPQWMHHLSFFKSDITDKLEHFGIRDVRFRIGRLPEPEVKELREEEAELSEGDIRYLDNTVRHIKDNELRNRFRRLISHGLKRGKKPINLK